MTRASPDRHKVLELRERYGLEHALEVPGFVDAGDVDNALKRALCLVLPSSREGYGMVVVEAARHGTPSVVVDGPDNAAVELVRDHVNGVVAASPSPEDLGGAILQVRGAGEGLRRSTRAWFAEHATSRSLDSSVAVVIRTYRELVRASS